MNGRRRVTTILALGACAAAAVVARGSAAAPTIVLDPADPRTQRVRQLHDDISLANLLGGLTLSSDQLDDLEELARRADELRDEVAGEAEPLAERMERAFAALRADLLERGAPSDEVAGAAHRAERDFRELNLSYERDLAALEQRARDVLDDGQIAIIEGFEPCLFPPRDLSSPLRVGQAGVSTEMMERLWILRQLPEHTGERYAERLVDGAVERLEMHRGPQSDEAIAAERERVRALLDEIRAVDDETWALEGETMAERLEAAAGAPPSSRGPAPGHVDDQLTRVGLLLLAPGAADVLAAYAAQADEAAQVD